VTEEVSPVGMRDDKEQLEFVGIERDGDRLVARMRSLDPAGGEWVADRLLLEIRVARLINGRLPRGASLVALAQLLRHELEATHNRTGQPHE
jgi:hypothetical protein